MATIVERGQAVGSELDLVPAQIIPLEGNIEDALKQLRPIDGDFRGKDIVSIDQFGQADVAQVMEEAEMMATQVRAVGRSRLLEDKVVANLFYEPSTRTFLSFEAAAARLGAGKISTQGVEFSSISKGETLEDTVRTVERYADIITLRHSKIGAAAIAAANTRIPIINGGDGVGEHPTQALLDLRTIREKAVRPLEEGLRITFLGDLKNGRTVHSLARLVALYDGVSVNYVAPEGLQMPHELSDRLAARGLHQHQTCNLEEVLPKTDVLYATRIQKERFENPDEYAKHKNAYIIGTDTMRQAPQHMILMHPLPRVDEVHPDTDADRRSVIFDEVENGMYVRMALLALVMGRGKTQTDSNPKL
jgi:aspartate carbamoyltransferase